MPNPSFAYKIPLGILEQCAEKLIKHDELEAAEALLQAIVAEHSQYTFAYAMLNSIKDKTMQKRAASQPKYYVDQDYHTGVFEVLGINDDIPVAVFDTQKEAEEYLKKW